MVAIGMALIRRPRLLLLDEPSIGLSPVVAHALFDVMRTINRDLEVTIILAEQNIRLALEVCTTVCVLRLGQVAWTGAQVALDTRTAIDIVRML